MFKHYATDYANQLHQLTVSVSRHFWLTKDAIVKYQQKPIEQKLSNIADSPKNHIVIYSVRDHFSGLFYFTVANSNSLINPSNFLKSAWVAKETCAFKGEPDFISVPETVELAFPGTKQKLEAQNILLAEVTSGFQGGVRDIRTIEEYLKGSANKTFQEAVSSCAGICRWFEASKSQKKGYTKLQWWQQNKKPKDQNHAT